MLHQSSFESRGALQIELSRQQRCLLKGNALILLVWTLGQVLQTKEGAAGEVYNIDAIQ